MSLCADAVCMLVNALSGHVSFCTEQIAVTSAATVKRLGEKLISVVPTGYGHASFCLQPALIPTSPALMHQCQYEW